MKRAFAAIALLAALTACSSEPEEVEWSKYPDGLQQRIDGSTDCRELQDLFDALDDMDEATRTAHGTGTGDVLGYLDARLEEVGCYE